MSAARKNWILAKIGGLQERDELLLKIQRRLESRVNNQMEQDRMIDEAEQDIKAGRTYPADEAWSIMESWKST